MSEWNLCNLPPPGHKDVGPFIYELFVEAWKHKEHLGLPERWLKNYSLYRGKHWPDRNDKLDRHRLTINIIFANIQRTVANLISRDPSAQVTSGDGIQDEVDKMFNACIQEWWANTHQQRLLIETALNMEIYGPAIEKYVPNRARNCLQVIPVDPFSFFPAPGYKNINELPWVAHAYCMDIHEIENMFNVRGVTPDPAYTSILGDEREHIKAYPDPTTGTWKTSTGIPMVSSSAYGYPQTKNERALVIEVWLKDKRTIDISSEYADSSGTIMSEKYTALANPGGIRRITICNAGRIVLDDSPNPLVNHSMPTELISNTFGYCNFPFALAQSYRDNVTIWGFSSLEQLGTINLKIDELLSRIAHWIALVCMPPLILPYNIQINLEEITNRAGLILRPHNYAAASQIRFLEVPNLPSDFFVLLNLYLNLLDRIAAIQDIDRGQPPPGVQAASAILALQERNAVLMRFKTSAIDEIIRTRGRWMINYLQNFGLQQIVKVDGKPVSFRGTDYINRKFDYIIKPDSILTRSPAYLAEQARIFYQLGLIDRQAVLETTNFPNWQSIIERSGEGMLERALQILVEAGLPIEQARALKQYLLLPQGGPGSQGGFGAIPISNAGPGAPPVAGTPKVAQGTINQAISGTG